ncbi:hypothetical protein MMC15_003957 [Xylographa vitiligo]|nr:hypothetical protein [Xylographa vitiligo]
MAEKSPRRASISSFGYGGSNVHAIVEQAKGPDRLYHVFLYVSIEKEFILENEEAARPSILVLSANDAAFLRASIKALGNPLIDPRVKASLSDLAFALSERRTRLWPRAFITVQNTELDGKPEAWVIAKKSPQTNFWLRLHRPGSSMASNGQGSPAILSMDTNSKNLLHDDLYSLDQVLKSLQNPPSWSLVSELTELRSAEHIRQAKFSQLLVTALQLCIIAIAAAYTARLLDRAGAIIAALYRGRAAMKRKDEVESDFLGKHAGRAWIACFNSPSSVPVSGKVDSVIEIAATSNSSLAYLSGSTGTGANTDFHGNLVVVRLAETTPEALPPSLQATLEASAWTITTSLATSWAIAKVLELLKRNGPVETEYMERDGMLHVQQIILNAAVNGFRHADEEGLEPVVSAFHDTEVQVQLRAERLGTLQSSMWCETEICEPPLDAGKVEVKTMAALVWELLDASWRIIANDRNMVEIASGRLIDFYFNLFDGIFILIDAGHLKPIHPIPTFGFDDVIAALSYIRSGRHIAKIVISNAEKLDIQPDASYLIVGGLKGACGTLAIHMAQHGARHIIVSGRSGISEAASDRVVHSCRFYGRQVTEAKGHVGDIEAIRRMFKFANLRIAGIVQDAMVLRLGVSTGRLGSFSSNGWSYSPFLNYRQMLGLHANTVDLGLIEDVCYLAEQNSSLEVRFNKRQWTLIHKSMLRKILTYSILQQNISAPLNANSSTEMITGVGFPLPQDSSELARESAFTHLFNSRGGNRSAAWTRAMAATRPIKPSSNCS